MRKYFLPFVSAALVLASCELPECKQEQSSKPLIPKIEQVNNQSMIEDMLFPTVMVSVGESSGSGVIIKDKYVLTAKHCLNHNGQLVVWVMRGLIKQDFNATIASMSPTEDWAILRLDLPQEVILPSVNDQMYRTGFKLYSAKLPLDMRRMICEPFDEVIAIGYPLGYKSPSITSGVLGQGSNIGNVHSSPIIFGNSGGPVFDKNTHELLGINIALMSIPGTVDIPVTHSVMFLPLSKIADAIDQLNELKK